jgi:hypothetical protein
MAFNASNLTLWSPMNAPGPKYFGYLTTDTAATVADAAYFRPFADSSSQAILQVPFSVGDIINSNCSDGFVTVSISSIDPITTDFEPTDLGPDSVNTAAIQDDAVTTDKLDDGAVTNAKVGAAAAIAYSKLAALTSGNILVGSAGNVATSVAMSGDATIVASGALTIAANAITTGKILNANVTLGKLASGIAPSHVIKFGGQLTTVGGAAAEAFAVAGALAASDRAFVQIVDDGTSNVTVLQAVVTDDTLTVTFSANPGNDTVFNYQIIRAAA